MSRLPAWLLALSLGLLGGCGSDDPSGPGTPTPPPATPPPATTDVDIVRGASTLTTTAFNPNPAALRLDGGTEVRVRWVNRDGGTGYGGGPAEPHQITSDNGAFSASQLLRAGDAYTVTFTRTGTYGYHCAVHPNMVGTITVGE